MPETTTTKQKNKDGTTTVTKTTPKKFARKKMGALEFINNVLAKHAVSAVTGNTDYRGWTEEKNGKTLINFVSSAYQAKMDITHNYMFEVGNASGKSNVIAFKPTYTIVPDGTDSEYIIETSLLDKFTNEMYRFNFTNKGAFTSLSEQQLKNTSSDKIKYFASSSYTNTELERMAANLWLKQSKLAVQATLEILGDPHIKPMTNVSVVCIMPSGVPHVTSGVYLVTGVLHEIEGGLFKTTLTLLRNEIEVTIGEDGKIQFEIGAANDPSEESSSDDKDATVDESSNGDTTEKTAKGDGKVSGDWGLPFSGLPITVTCEFGTRADNHRGTDMVKGSAGEPILACNGGTVTKTGEVDDWSWGQQVVIDHGKIDGQQVYTRYAHMQAGSISVKVGQKVSKGQQIGKMGSTGNSSGPHLHLEFIVGGNDMQPVKNARNFINF